MPRKSCTDIVLIDSVSLTSNNVVHDYWLLNFLWGVQWTGHGSQKDPGNAALVDATPDFPSPLEGVERHPDSLRVPGTERVSYIQFE
jgi:hypothetical protein